MSAAPGFITDFDAYRIAVWLEQLLRNELLFHMHCKKYLSGKETALLYKYYYYYLFKNPPKESHIFAQRIRNTVKIIFQSRVRGRKLCILDCGCGFGTESIMFALLGAEVLGVDLSKERVNIAKKRVNYYRNRYPQIKVDFELRNILNYKCADSFDIIYAKEFISHVHPPEKFIKIASDCLRDGGYLIIHDTNPLNPLSRYYAWKEHRHGLYKLVRDPESGGNILYAVERLISPFTLRQLLLANKFQVTETYFYGWPGLIFHIFHKSLISFIETKLKIPFLPCYEIVSMKT